MVCELSLHNFFLKIKKVSWPMKNYVDERDKEV